MVDIAEAYARLCKNAEKRFAARTQRPTQADQAALWDLFHRNDSPLVVDVQATHAAVNRAEINRLKQLEGAIESWQVTAPGAPPRAMALLDRERPVEPVVFLRGDPARRGPRVPRRFLQLLAGPNAPPFRDGSGRRELAEAIANRNNPLTARVLVNRVWQHHFGRGLVDSPDDFGLRTPEPVHIELLDYLAWRFMQDGWSLKRLHRLILTSRTYSLASSVQDTRHEADSATSAQAGRAAFGAPSVAQHAADRRTERASAPLATAAAIDPENRLWWRAERRRLEFEALRDSLLQVTGLLDRRMRGKPVDLFDPSRPPRRTLYGFIDRYNVPPLLRFFDVADPDTSTARRSQTIVPQQALFMMNSELLYRASERIAGEVVAPDRPDQPHPSSTEAVDRSPMRPIESTVQNLFRRILARDPSPEELDTAIAFLRDSTAPRPMDAAPAASTPAGGPSASASGNDRAEGNRRPVTVTHERWRELAHALLMGNEFFFVD